MLRGGRRLAIALAAGGLLVSGCAESVSGSPSAAPQSAEDTSAEPDYPVADYEKPLIPVYQKLRQVDPCALHDVEAAKRISPDLDSLAPGDSLGRCTLQGTKPTRRPPEKDSVFKAACRFEAGGADVTLDKDKATGSLKLLLALVVWGDDASGMSADPAKRPGSVAKDYGGKPGLEVAGVDSQGNPECLGVVKTSRGYWGVSVTNAAFPGTQACAISQSVMTAVAAKMP